tara:strand:- start:173 stop:427 length:255 start_codon:yes stop_codon:yes gene_type:complete
MGDVPTVDTVAAEVTGSAPNDDDDKAGRLLGASSPVRCIGGDHTADCIADFLFAFQPTQDSDEDDDTYDFLNNTFPPQEDATPY